MPVSLSPGTTPPIKSESIAIFASYTNLSIFCWPLNTAGIGGLSPQLTAAYLGQYFHKIQPFISDQRGYSLILLDSDRP
jgi:hypothetical protein